jgi:uncharacterized protein (DUF1697 family)
MRHVLLLRGVNVGGHKKVPLATLRGMLTDLGYGSVRTLLNSGNAVFDVSRPPRPGKIAERIESAIEATFGFSARAFVLSAAEVDRTIAENPLAARVEHPSRLLVAFLRTPDDVARVAPLLAGGWGKDALGLGSQAAYLWCQNGISQSELPDAVGRALRADVTTRNWATLLKIQAVCQEG